MICVQLHLPRGVRKEKGPPVGVEPSELFVKTISTPRSCLIAADDWRILA